MRPVPGPGTTAQRCDLCAACEAELPAAPMSLSALRLAESRPARRSASARGAGQTPPPYDRCHAAFGLRISADGLVQGLKYDGQLANARVFGTLLGRSVATSRAAPRSRCADPRATASRASSPSVASTSRIEIARWRARLLRPAVLRPCVFAPDTRHAAAGRAPLARRVRQPAAGRSPRPVSCEAVASCSSTTSSPPAARCSNPRGRCGGPGRRRRRSGAWRVPSAVKRVHSASARQVDDQARHDRIKDDIQPLAALREFLKLESAERHRARRSPASRR